LGKALLILGEPRHFSIYGAVSRVCAPNSRIGVSRFRPDAFKVGRFLEEERDVGALPVGEDRMSLKNGYLAIALMSGLAMAACSNTAAGAKKDAEINADKAAAASDEAKVKADRAADKAAAESREATADAKDKTRDATGALKGAVETIDVKTALMADRTVDASHINVDTFHETKTVVLRGSVKTATQRDEAARIAAAEAPSYRIDNQLTVVPNP